LLVIFDQQQLQAMKSRICSVGAVMNKALRACVQGLPWLLGIGGISIANANAPIVVDGAGRAIGYLYGDGIAYCDNGGYAVISRTVYFACINTTGYLEGEIRAPGAQIDGLYWNFLSLDCTGAPYLGLGGSIDGGPELATGGVVSTLHAGIAMVLKGQVLSHFTAFSADSTSGCSPASGGFNLWAVPVIPNDPRISAIFDGPYKPPLSVQVLDESVLYDEIYFNSFEAVGY